MHVFVQMCQNAALHMSPLNNVLFFRVVSSTKLHANSRLPMALGRGMVTTFNLPLMHCMASKRWEFVH